MAALQATVHDQQTQPFSEFPTCIWQQPDLLKSERRMQSDGGGINSTDTSNHRVTVFCLAFCYQTRQEHLADSVTDAIRADINRVFDGIAITFARSELR